MQGGCQVPSLEVIKMSHVAQRRTTEQVWIARLMDACCPGGYGPIAGKHATLGSGNRTAKLRAAPAGRERSAASVDASDEQDPRVTNHGEQKLVGSAEKQH